MIALTAEEAGRALGLAPFAAPVPGVCIDSRSIKRGDLFVALRGERFDGHDFVAAAFAAGASGAVVERRAWSEAGGHGDAFDEGHAVGGAGAFAIYQVANTLEALGALAREVRRKSGAMVFAITGSVGKTSTKDLLGAMVGRVRQVVSTAANQNNEVGVPLTLFAIEPDTEAVIVEMGMRGRGQIAALARVAEPDVGVITNVHPVHLELLGTVEAIAEAKAELLGELKPGGVAVVPVDCVYLRPFIVTGRRRVVSFGVGREADCADVQGWPEGNTEGLGGSLRLRWPEGQVLLETPDLPLHFVKNAVAAAAACYAAGLPVEECATGMTAVQVSGGRGDVLRLPGLCVIDDTYNANPAAVRAALENLVRIADETGGRPVAVLGDMLELGPESEGFHREVGEYAAHLGVEALWGVGPRSRATMEGFRNAREARVDGSSEVVAGHVGSAEETPCVLGGLRPGDVVLFKASRSMHLEIMVRGVVDGWKAGMKETRTC